jgi:hypothetical protein
MNTAELHSLDIERDWLDGLKAIEEQFEEAPRAQARIVRIGKGLLAGRLKCPANIEFNLWLNETGYRAVDDDERQDSMWLCVNAAIVLPVIAPINLTYAPRIRRYIRESLPVIYAQCQDVRSFTVMTVDGPAGTSPGIPAEASKQPAELSDPPEPPPQESNSKVDEAPLPRTKPRSGGGAKWKLANCPDADLVQAHVTRVQSRSALAAVVTARGGRPIWDLLVDAIKLGHYGPPSIGNEKPNLRMILPWVPPGNFAESINIKTADDRRHIRDIIFPLLTEKAELKAEPGNFGKAVARRRFEIEEKLRQTRQMEHHAAVIAQHQFEPGEQEIIAYGLPMWPRDRDPGYTYDELKHACWYVSFFLGSIAHGHRDWSLVSTAMMGRHLIKWISPVAPGVTKAIKEIFSAYELNPTGERKFPMTPVNFGID